MDYYIIYRKEQFVGYTTSYDMLQKFLKTRKHIKYMIRVFKEKEIDSEILKLNTLSDYELSFYNGYTLYNEFPVFEYERELLDESLFQFLSDMYTDTHYFVKSLKFIKFTEDEKENVFIYLNSLLDNILYIFEQSDQAYDEIIDIKRFFLKFVIDKPHRLKGDIA